jgi:hypothetical protein
MTTITNADRTPTATTDVIANGTTTVLLRRTAATKQAYTRMSRIETASTTP